MRILVIEDDAIARRVLELFLKPYGTIETAKNGDEGFAKFAEAHKRGASFDLLCLDIYLPGKAGLEVLSEVREFESATSKARAVSAIMLTGSADEKQIETAKALGAIGYLLKPVIESDLVALLGKLGIRQK
jgi:CheY-like chemotaxis protein